MEKVKITQEQHMSLKYATTHKSNQSIVKSRVFGDIDKELSELRLDELIRALYIGYEVEPELSEGDILFYPNIGTFAEIRNNKAYWNDGAVNDLEYTKELIKDGEIRHATELEIAAEKERRWWNELGRQINQFKAADLVTVDAREGVHEVVNYHDANNLLVTDDFASTEHLIDIRHLKLVCPVENRLDINHD